MKKQKWNEGQSYKMSERNGNSTQRTMDKAHHSVEISKESVDVAVKCVRLTALRTEDLLPLSPAQVQLP